MKKKWLLSIVLTIVLIFAFLPLSSLNADPVPGTSLVVTKTAIGSSEGYLTWDIDKSVDTTSFSLTTGETATANYTITLTPNYHETGRVVEGNIHIDNVGGEYAWGSSIVDIVEYEMGGVWHVLEMEFISGLFTIEAGNHLDLPYSISFFPVEGATAYRNTVVAGLNNYALPGGGTGFYEFMYTIEFSISGGTVTSDAFVDVSDSLKGYLGQTWVGDTSTYTYTYSMSIGPYSEPGDYTIDNIVIATGTDSNIESTDSSSITIHIVYTKGDALINSGVPGKGLDTAPGQQKPFNPKSQASKHAGKKK